MTVRSHAVFEEFWHRDGSQLRCGRTQSLMGFWHRDGSQLRCVARSFNPRRVRASEPSSRHLRFEFGSSYLYSVPDVQLHAEGQLHRNLGLVTTFFTFCFLVLHSCDDSAVVVCCIFEVIHSCGDPAVVASCCTWSSAGTLLFVPWQRKTEFDLLSVSVSAARTGQQNFPLGTTRLQHVFCSFVFWTSTNIS